MKPLVTIITVCKNADAVIEKTLQSVLAQSYPNIEYIIIDGASADGTLERIKNHQKDLAHFISAPDKGIYDAMNKGLQLATGDWVNFMNAGDYFAHENAISTIIEQATSDISVLYCDVFLGKNEGKAIRQHRPVQQYGLYHNVCHQAVFYNLAKLGHFQFDTRYQVAADFDILLKIATTEKGQFYRQIDVPLVVYQGGGMSEKQALQALEERKTQFKFHIKNPVIRLWNQLNLYRQIRKKS